MRLVVRRRLEFGNGRRCDAGRLPGRCTARHSECPGSVRVGSSSGHASTTARRFDRFPSPDPKLTTGHHAARPRPPTRRPPLAQRAQESPWGMINDNVAVGELILVAGPPGAGKSSVSEQLVSRRAPSALVAGDNFFSMIKHGYIQPWLPQAHHQNRVVIEAAAAAAGRLTRICFVVYDGVVGPWFLPTFVRAAGLADLHYVVLMPPLDVCQGGGRGG